MDSKMDVKKFLIYYGIMSVIIIVFGKMFPEWVKNNTMLYYINLVGAAFPADILSRRGNKKDK